jgi:hypothetical protein
MLEKWRYQVMWLLRGKAKIGTGDPSWAQYEEARTVEDVYDMGENAR